MPQIFTPSSRTGLDSAWITLEGPDALDFLHRVTSVNTRAIQVGEGARGCFLTPLGKLRALFTLWNYDEGHYGFEFDPGTGGKWRESLLASIDQYTFAEKITLAPVTGLESRWILCEPGEVSTLLFKLGAAGLEAGHTRAIEEELRICHHGSLDFGRPWITVWGRPARLMQWMDLNFGDAATVDAETLDAWRIHSVRPRVDRELSLENTIPLEAGLVDALAPNKGCYPGQEVIERIITQGSPPRRLARVDGTGDAPAIDTPVFNDAEPPVEVGRITSVASTDRGRFEALIFLRKNYAKSGLKVRFTESGTSGTVAEVAPYTSTPT